MKLTNRLGLPDAIVKAVANHGYERGDADYTVTQLLNPPRIAALTRQHWNDIEEDVSDRIWALLGTVVHGILERAETVASVEERLTAQMIVDITSVTQAQHTADVNSDRLAAPAVSQDLKVFSISGKYDRCVVFPDGLLQDYKLMSVWEVIHGLKADREQQLNMLAWIARENGIDIKKLEVVAIYRDWSKGKAREGGNYPQTQVQTIPVELWKPSRTEAFIAERIRLHEAAKVELPECTDEERWAADYTYAVMKQGNKRAVRVLATEKEANDYIVANGLMGCYVVPRQEDPVKRCRDYCSAAPFCSQFQALSSNLPRSP